MDLKTKILLSRRNYGDSQLTEDDISSDPAIQFKTWFEEVLDNGSTDPSTMVLATVDENGYPDTRVVLLLGFEKGSFFFYTSYQSTKAQQIMLNNAVAVNFYWPSFTRQVRIKGTVQKTSRELSSAYFTIRNRGGQLATYGPRQSSIVKDRAVIFENFKKMEDQFANREIPCPEHWGGYQITPSYYEFFQGRDNRLHDRIIYSKNALNNEWEISRLAP